MSGSSPDSLRRWPLWLAFLLFLLVAELGSGGGGLTAVLAMAAVYLAPLPVAVLAVRAGISRTILISGLVTAGLYFGAIAFGEGENAANWCETLLTVAVAPGWILGYGVLRSRRGIEIALTLSAFFLAVFMSEMLILFRTADLSSIGGLIEARVSELSNLSAESITPEMIEQSGRLMIRLLPGVFVLAAAVQGFVTMMFASIVLPLFRAGSLWQGRFSRWQLPDKFIWAAIISMIGTAASIRWGLPDPLPAASYSVLLFAMALYWIQGLAVIRFFLRVLPFWIGMMMVVSALIFYPSLALIGVLDAFFDLRRRIVILPPPPPSGDGGSL